MGDTPQYIIGAFRNGEIFKNLNYNANYYDKDASIIDDPTTTFISKDRKEKEAELCTELFYKNLNKTNTKK